MDEKKALSPDNLRQYSEETSSKIKEKIAEHTDNTNVHVTTADRSKWNSKFDSNQGTSNAGKLLGTNSSGDVVAIQGYGFEYDETTKMLKYGTDPTTNLNQGIGLDDTLSKKGYAAEASAVGELKSDLGKLIVKSPNIFDKSKAKKGIFYTVGVGEEPYEKTNAGYFGAIVEVNPNTTYTIKLKGYYTYFLDENRIRTGGIQGDASLSSLTVTTTNSTRYIVFSSNIESLNTNMIVEGETVPTEFIPYGVQYGEVLDEINEKISANTSAIENIGVEEIYHVGVDKEYTKFYDCLKALAGNEKKKTIYVHAGTYDLFDEIGGVDFINSIQSGVSWRDVNTVIPPNTKIIGIGNVVFNYMPTSEQVTVLSAGLISPINCNYSVEIENITVNAQNCRYCIHDESSGWDIYDSTIHKYKNVRAIFHDGGVVGSPSGIAFAGGFGSNVVFDFDNCYFETKRTSGGAFYLHNWKSIGTNGSLISLKNCVLLNVSDNATALQLGNLHNNTMVTENVVSVDNCYLKGKISVIKGSSGDTSNTFNVKALKSASSVEIDSMLINEFVPQIFN